MGELDAVIVQLFEAVADPPEPVAVAVNVWAPRARPVSVVGLEQADVLPLSRRHVTAVAFCVVHAKVALCADVETDGLCVKVICGADGVGLGDGDEEVVTVHDLLADVLPPLPVAVATKVCEPAESEVSVVGLEHELAPPPSTRHDTEEAFCVTHAKVAAVDVVEAAGDCVNVIVGAAAGGGGGAVAPGSTLQASASACCELPFQAETSKRCLPTARFV